MQIEGMPAWHAARTSMSVGPISIAAVTTDHDEIPFRVTDSCVAHCTFCAQHVPRRTPDLATDEVLTRLRRTLTATPARRVVLGGGEPTLHPKLAQVIALAKDLGCREVAVESLGVPLAQLARLQALQQAGLSEVRMTVLGSTDEAAAKLGRLYGICSAQSQAAAHCHALKIPLTVQTPAVKGTVEHLGDIAAFVATLSPQRWVLQPYVGGKDGAPQTLHPQPRAMEGMLAQALSRVRAQSIAVTVPPGKGWHWCAFAQPHKFGPLLVRTGATGRRHLPPCEQCAARNQCPGVERSLAERFGDAMVAPIADLRTAAWLPVHAPQAKSNYSARHDALPVERAGADGQEQQVHELVLRIVHQCNQRCGFCWVDFSQPAMDLVQIEARIRESMRNGKAARVAFTGGEPTLHPNLGEAVALAKLLGAPSVTLQTNATRMTPALAVRLQRVGLSDALVSLHSASAYESDALTAAPGSWQHTIDGVRALCAAGVEVKLNHVLTRNTGQRFGRFIEFVADKLLHPRLKVTVAVAGHIDGGPIDKQSLPTHSELGAFVEQGLLSARERGVRLVGLTHPCGLVPCTVPNAIAAFAGHELGKPVADSERLRDGGVKVPGCKTCVFDGYCFGVRKEYAAAHGLDELQPVIGSAVA